MLGKAVGDASDSTICGHINFSSDYTILELHGVNANAALDLTRLVTAGIGVRGMPKTGDGVPRSARATGNAEYGFTGVLAGPLLLNNPRNQKQGNQQGQRSAQPIVPLAGNTNEAGSVISLGRLQYRRSATTWVTRR